MMKWRVQTWALILVLALGVSAAWAQQQKDPRLNPPVAPLPPIMSGESSSKAQMDDPVPSPQNALKPDESPLSGAEAFSLGIKSGGRSYVKPAINYMQFADNTQRTSTSVDDWRTTGTLTGNLTLHNARSRSQLGIDYSGGGVLFSTFGSSRITYHRLGFNERISWRRVTLLLADSMTYLPESSFGGGGFGGISSGLLGGLGNAGIGSGLQPGMVPSQSILTGRSRRISNAAVGQIQFAISPRASMTAGGSYGLLRFLDSGFISSNNYQFSTGYNYKLSAADTIGVIYSMNMQRFVGINRSADFHNLHLAYGRRLTGRLAMQLTGGPQFGKFTNPVGGSGNRVSWSVRSSLLYNFKNTNLGLAYSHGASSGSGVVAGADTDQVDGSLSRQLTRMWSGNLVFGFAHNKSIQALNAAATNRNVSTWHTGFQLHRPLSRKANLSFTYSLTGQSANSPPGCTGLACGRLPLRHLFSLGINWGFGPYAID